MGQAAVHDATIVDQHTRQAEGYARLTDRSSAAPDRSAELRALLAAGPGDDLLDVACGPGSLALDLAPHVRRATGLDLTPAMLDQARQAQVRAGIDNVRWVSGHGAAMPFASGQFSLVACRAAFHHFSDPHGVMREMVRVCAPAGRLAVIDVTPAPARAEVYNRIERMRDPSHARALAIEELAAMAAALGLGRPRIAAWASGPMPFAAVLATSFPVDHTREELMTLMRADAQAGNDELGFSATLAGDEVMVTYRMTTMVWDRASA